MKKLAVYFIFQLLIICPEILCTSVFIALHNLFIPTATYTPHLFTTVTATDRSGFSQCYNFPSEKARSSSGSEHHLLDHMHRQLSVVSACSPFFSPTAQGIFTEKNGN